MLGNECRSFLFKHQDAFAAYPGLEWKVLQWNNPGVFIRDGLRVQNERKKKVFNNSQIIFKNSLAIISAV